MGKMMIIKCLNRCPPKGSRTPEGSKKEPFEGGDPFLGVP